MTMSMKRLLPALAALAVTVPGSLAFAASSGTIAGKLYFYQNQGNYCPTGRDCTGARYREAEYHTNQPIANAKVYIRRKSDDTVLGQGTTGTDGAYSIHWTDPSTSADVEGQIVFRGENKDGRFQIRNTDLGYWIWWSNVTLQRGETTEAGTRTWGNSSSPHALSNLYDGANSMWSSSLTNSARMRAKFTDLDIVAYDGEACPTSCASGPKNRVTIDSSESAYRPQARVMHEMGHIASYLASDGYKQAGSGTDAYCFGGESSPCGWGMTEAEWAAVHFEEAFATFLGDVAFYGHSALEPRTCNSSSSCGNHDLETSGGTSCPTDDNRRPINAVRYFWDVYDDHSDYTGESLSESMFVFIDTMHDYENGVGDGQRNEVWDADLSSIDDRDGRSCIDFRENMKKDGPDSTLQLAHNCGSKGD